MRRGWLGRQAKGPPEILDEALDALAVPPEHRDRWRGRLHYAAVVFLMHRHAERNAPRRKDLAEVLADVEGWHRKLDSLDVECFSRLSNAMGEIGPGTLDQLMSLLRQLQQAAEVLRKSTPPDRGGRSNLVTERVGTAHGQLVLDLIQRIEAGVAAGEIGQDVRITGGAEGSLARVARIVCRYASGEDDSERVEYCVRHAATKSR